MHKNENGVPILFSMNIKIITKKLGKKKNEGHNIYDFSISPELKWLKYGFSIKEIKYFSCFYGFFEQDNQERYIFKIHFIDLAS